MAKKKRASRTRRSRPGRARVKRGATLGFAPRTSAAPAGPGPQPIAVDFTARVPPDLDVSSKSDAELGAIVRLTAEDRDGAWVFQALNAQGVNRIWLRRVARP